VLGVVGHRRESINAIEMKFWVWDESKSNKGY
jgi:hypothetical protein